MSNPPEMARKRANVAEIEGAEVERINAWIMTRPGVFGPYRDESSTWQEAYRTFGGSPCGLGLFSWHIKRAGYAVEDTRGGFRLDLSDPALIIEIE